MALTLNDAERALLRRTVEARVAALRTEMARTDTPDFSVELGREEKILLRLLDRLRLPARRSPATRRPARGSGRRPATRAASRRR